MKTFTIIAGGSHGVMVYEAEAVSLEALKARMVKDNDGCQTDFVGKDQPNSEYWPESGYMIVEGKIAT